MDCSSTGGGGGGGSCHRARILLVNLTISMAILMNLRPAGVESAPGASQRRRLNLPTDLSATSSETANSSAGPSSAPLLVAAGEQLESSALNYLQKYGYMSASSGGPETNNLVSEESFSSAVADFQRFVGLPTSGLVDNQTLELMRLPRCGNSDRSTPMDLSGGSGHGSVVRKSGQLRRRRRPPPALLSGWPQQQVASGGLQRRRKRYALQGSKWRRQELTYRISQYPTRFLHKKHEVDGQIERAFGIWSQVAPIDFVVKRDGRVHIDIRFASGDHGDGDAFDGPGNTLAHAYFPQYGGDAHFDDQEYWTVDSFAGTNIFQVAAHELGHSLGLGHSNVREALMAPFYQKYKPNFKLHMDDILAIQALYGEKPLSPVDPLAGGPSGSAPTTGFSTTTTTTTTTSTTPPPSSRRPSSRYPIYKGLKPPQAPSFEQPTKRPPDSSPGDDHDHGEPSVGREVNEQDVNENNIPDLADGSAGPGAQAPPLDADLANGLLCAEPKIDAITRTEDGSSYVFKADLYWLLTNDGLAKGYPRRISADWDGLPGHLDAALTWADGKTFFFKGNKYWRFRNKRRDVGYPKLISSGFAGVPNDIDAAFVWSGNGRTYIFKGTEYWRFDSKAEPPVSGEYPRQIKVWSGLPAGGIDAAFKWDNNVTYFFSGHQYFRFNDRDFKVETRGRPPFPRPTGEWWFGCGSAQRAGLRDHRPGAGGPIQNGSDSSDWSFLAGLADAEQTRMMGTHISDHKPQEEGPPVSPPAGSGRERSSHEMDVALDREHHSRRTHSGAGPEPNRDQPAAGGREPRLGATSSSSSSRAARSSSSPSAIFSISVKRHQLQLPIATLLLPATTLLLALSSWPLGSRAYRLWH